MKKIIILIALITSCIWANCEKQVKVTEVNGRSLSRVLCHEADREVIISIILESTIIKQIIHKITYTNGYKEIIYATETQHVASYLDDFDIEYKADSLEYIKPYSYFQELRNLYGF